MSDTNSKNIIQILTFRLGEELFALDVTSVREVLDIVEIRKVPKTPEFMRGIINVRGNIVPVIDMSRKLGMQKTDKNADSRIIVMDFNMENNVIVVGAMADSVHEVIDLDLSQLQPPPDINSRWESDYIRGIAKYNDEFIMLLDLNYIFSETELTCMTNQDMIDSDTSLKEEENRAAA